MILCFPKEDIGMQWNCPVLKHGPRSISNKRVKENSTLILHNESKLQWKTFYFIVECPHILWKHLVFNKSLFDVTRKMVNYTWQGSSQGKL